MGKIKRPRDAKGASFLKRAPALKGITRTYNDITATMVPVRTTRNAPHCHYLKGSRDINRIDWKAWEPKTSGMLRKLEIQRLNVVNRFYDALKSVQDMLKAVHMNEQKLQKLLCDLKSSQSRLIHTGKMGVMGTMTTGIAHELNNPMAGILNFIQYCLQKTSEDDKRYSVLNDAVKETKRCIAIIQNLLTFSRMEKEGEEDRETTCATIFERVFQLLNYRFQEEHVLVEQHTSEGTPAVCMKENSIQQVFFNLISNALDAVQKSDKKEIHVDIQRQGEYVLVTISDSGVGIAPENFSRIFEPFFTTKAPGKGTGLGLFICHSIINTHGGEITFESKLGGGTKFKVLLPVTKRTEVGK